MEDESIVSTAISDAAADIMGEILLSRFHGNDVYGVVEREDGFSKVSDGVLYYFAVYQEWARTNREAMTVVRGKVLDIGCGVGRVGLYLQGKGYDVTSIDKSPLAIQICRERGLGNSHVLDINDIGELKGNTFDTVLLLGNCFGLLQDRQKARYLLKEIFTITSHNAVIAAETHTPYSSKRQVHVRYRQHNRKARKMPGQETIRLKFGIRTSPWFDDLSVSKREMKHLIYGTGWKVDRYIDEPDSAYYVALLKKQ